MISLFSVEFWLYFVLFVGAITVAFFIPGDVLVARFKFTLVQRVVTALVVGMALWGIQGYIFGFLGIRMMTYGYLLIFLVYYCTKIFRVYPWNKKMRPDWLVIGIIGLGALTQVVSIFFNGLFTINGLYFCCGVPDNLYHIALTNELIKNVPPFEPGMSGVVVQNYHFVSNLIFADLIRIFHLPLIFTLYQYSVILFSILIGLSALVFLQITQAKGSTIRWVLFFLYFSGDILFLLLFFLGKGLDFRFTFLHDATKLWSSPPRVYAIPIFFVSLSMFYIWMKERKMLAGTIAILLASVLIGVKIYVGIFLMIGVAAVGLYFLIKKDLQMIIPLLLAIPLVLLLYLPVNGGAGGIFYTGFWRFEDFIANGKFGLSHLELARRVYLEHDNILRLIQYEIMYIVLYFFFIFGTLNLSFVQTRKSLAAFPNSMHRILIPGLLVSLIIGFFFQQKTGGANTAQFIITSLMVLALYAGISVSYWLRILPRNLALILATGIVLLTAGRVVFDTGVHITRVVRQEGFMISREQLKVTDYLTRHVSSNSLILAHDKVFTQSNNQYALSFLIPQPLYLSGSGILRDHGVDTLERERTMRTIFYNPSISSVSAALQNSNIDFLVMPKGTVLYSTASAALLIPEYTSLDLSLYRVDKEKVESILQGKK